MLLWAVFGFIGVKPKDGQPWSLGLAGGSLLLFVLIAMLGWKVFGAALKG